MNVQAEHGSVAEMPCMSFWCMFAGVVMQRLQTVGVRSILLTSGTLSPLAATAEELCIPIPVRLENPHVVKPSQVRCLNTCTGNLCGSHRHILFGVLPFSAFSRHTLERELCMDVDDGLPQQQAACNCFM